MARRRKNSPIRAWLRTGARWVVTGVLVLGAIAAALVASLRWIDPPTTAFMLQWRFGADEQRAIHHHWLDWERIPRHMALAVVAAEDQKFPAHWGFDTDQIRDAVVEAARGGRVRGASTISQQVAKNLFLWPGRSLLRKAVEAYLTLLLEVFWSKQRILEVYLNVAEFGPGVFGVSAASARYFRTPAERIGPDEAALLAAVLPSPRELNPAQPSAYVAARARWIREQMSALGGAAYLNAL